jgi:hypothetical protein
MRQCLEGNAGLVFFAGFVAGFFAAVPRLSRSAVAD